MTILSKILRQGFLSSLLVVCTTLYSFSQNHAAPEYQLKAVFLYNFTQFVEWPSSSFATAQDPIVIGVCGKNPFGIYLKDLVMGENVNGHPIVIQYYSVPSEIKTCHILYINKTELDQFEQIVANLKTKNVLLVSDAPEFLTKGGMVRFYNSNNKIQLQINVESTKQADLVVSSKLLRLATIYTPNK